MKIQAIENYFDIRLQKQILKGDVYEVTKERAKEISDKGLAIAYVPINEEEYANRETISKSKKV